MMKLRFFTALLFCGFLSSSIAQIGGFGKWEYLYSDASIKVEIAYRIRPCNGGEESNNRSKYKYRITGSPKYASDYYLNWKMDYVDCNGNLFYRNNALNIGRSNPHFSDYVSELVIPADDEEFTCKSLENAHYDTILSYTKSYGGGVKALPLSKDPKSVLGNRNVYKGDATTLTVNGGTLGVGAKWVWYSDACGGQQIGTGAAVTVSPYQTTSYFVRAEGKNITNCADVTVIVSQLSVAPTAISGDATICKGESTTLSVSGGRLGAEAEWVWYSNSCGGTKIGTGKSITVSPTKSVTYYVRAEGTYNKTDCASATVNTYERSIAPVQITTSKITCANEPITLSVSGGSKAPDATWTWYNGSCGESILGTGTTIKYTPEFHYSNKVFVRAEGECNTTPCTYTSIYADAISKPATGILNSNEYNKIKLELYGGSLGKGAVWKWYKNGVPFATGATINTTLKKKPMRYSVRAEGNCNTTAFTSIDVAAKTKRKWSSIYTLNNKFLHLGFGIGFDLASYSIESTIQNVTSQYGYHGTHNSNTTKSVVRKQYTPMGIQAEFVFHPYMKDFFSIGIITAGAVCVPVVDFSSDMNNYSSLDGNVTITNGKNLYTRFDLGMELAAGYSKLKFLAQYKSSFQTLFYSHTVSNDLGSFIDEYSTSYNQQMRKETISSGIRVASYSIENWKKPKTYRYRRGYCFDFLYHFGRDYTWNWNNPINWNYKPLSNFQHGFGMAMWVQSVLKLQLDVMFQSSYANYTTNIGNRSMQFSLIYNRNSFY